MNKKIGFLILSCMLFSFVSCAKQEDESVTGSLTCAYIVAYDDTSITIDIIEWITDDDIYRIRDLMYQGIIGKPDYNEGHLTNGYFEYNPEDILVTFKINEDTVYSFIDWDHQYELPEGAMNYVTKDYNEFKAYLSTYTNGIPGMPLFFDIQDGIITQIVEVFIA